MNDEKGIALRGGGGKPIAPFWPRPMPLCAQESVVHKSTRNLAK